ncbi:hypothetical protein COLO4_25271 [Corchorus olitorius]|uniref:Uncharacterized protein n=1 Tax=Corchorus olitorius TaxID=93759 RepID=A0A1R3I3P8_9ROSI|nr:hypothetical protein COLO4_25271 [Corchorus olitorius]
MESDLLEISGEDDDSLLLQHHQSPNADVSAFNASYFSCSPLHFPGSNPPDKNTNNPSLSSSVDKENISNNVNKSEAPKLNLEPQQMKRKKRGGGYNLRKSLAWDRAFFTEEGVLNSTELSLISGNFGKLSGGTLSVIEEERRESLSSDSIDLQALETNLFKELPLNDSTKNEDKKIGSSSLVQKSSGSASRSAVRPNVHSAHDVNRSGSKRSEEFTLTFQTLKKPANVSTTKAAVKEPKISKIPAPKPDSSVLPTTAKSAPNINKPKRIQSAQAAAHRSIGLTGSTKSTRSTQNDSKASLSSRSPITKSSAQQAKRNLGGSALPSKSSTCLKKPLVIKADNVLKVNQDPVTGAVAHGYINHEANLIKIASIPQSGCHNGGNTQHAQPRMAKPSGLRMPSPSLGFFTQSKTNASQNLQSSTKPSNTPSNIPNFRKLGVINAISEKPASSTTAPAVTNGVATAANARISSTESSVPSSVNSLCQNIQPNLQMPRVDVKVLDNSNNHELMNNRLQSQTIYNDIKQQIIENVGLQGVDDKLLLECQSSEQGKLDYKRRVDVVVPRGPDHHRDELNGTHFVSHHSLQIKGVSKTDGYGNQLSENEQHGSSKEVVDSFPKLRPSDVNSFDINGSLKVNDNQISSLHGSHKQTSKLAEQAKPCTFDDDQMIDKTEGPHMSDGAILKEGETSEGFLSYNGVQNNDIYLKVRDCIASELERSHGLSHYGGRVLGKDGAGEAAPSDLKSHVGDAEMHSLEGDLSAGNSNSLLNASEAYGQNLSVHDINKKVVEQSPLSDPDSLVEKVIQANYGSCSIDSLLNGEIFSSEEFLAQRNLQTVKDVEPELADAYENELGNSVAHILIPPAPQNCGHEMNDVVQCLDVKNAVSVSTVMQCNNDIELLCKSTSEGSERIGQNQVTRVINAFDFDVINDCQSRGKLKGREVDNFNSVPPTSPVVRIKSYSEIDDSIDLKSVEDHEYNMSAKCNSNIFEPEEQITGCHVDTSVMLKNSSLDKQYDHEKSIAQSDLICSSSEACKSQENQIPEAYTSLLSVDEKAFQECHHFDSDNHADLSPKDKICVRQLAEGPDDLSQVQCPDEPNVKCAAGSNGMTKRFFKEDALSQSFDDSRPHLSMSAESNNSAMVVEDLNLPPELQNAVIVEQILSEKSQSSVNEEVSSSVKINEPDDNNDCYNNIIFRPDNEQSGEATSLNFVLSSFNEDEISAAGNTCSSQVFCTLNEETTSSGGNVLLEEVSILEKNVPQELNGAMNSVEAKDGTTSFEKNGNDTKEDAAVVKPPPHAIPFSDEWLAVFEAAGEEILTMKSGAVQHSPKDKSLPEPSPWSPVRRKNNQGIGPFDCTKFTNTNFPSASD